MTLTITKPQAIDIQLKDVLAHFPTISIAILFGSVSSGRQRADSELDIAVGAKRELTADEKMVLVDALAESTGRPIDLVDLRVVSGPLLGQIFRHGRRVIGIDPFLWRTD
jgi:predicted nucleotidyltransferase